MERDQIGDPVLLQEWHLLVPGFADSLCPFRQAEDPLSHPGRGSSCQTAGREQVIALSDLEQKQQFLCLELTQKRELEGAGDLLPVNHRVELLGELKQGVELEDTPIQFAVDLAHLCEDTGVGNRS